MIDMRKVASVTGKLATVAVAGAMMFTMAACGGKKDDTETIDSDKTTEVSSTDEDEITTDDTDSSATDTSSDVTTQTTGAAYAYDYTPGTLNTVMDAEGAAPAVPGFSVTGMMLLGNQQETGVTDAAKTGGYKTSGLISDFRLNEWIEFYLDEGTIAQCGTDTQIVAVPHSDASEYAGITADKLVVAAENTGGFILDINPENIEQVDGLNLVASGYVNADTGTIGTWDILFVKSGKVAQYVCVNMTPSI